MAISSPGVEGVDPTEAREAGKISITGIQFGSVLDGEGGQVGIVHEVARRSQRFEELPDHDGMAITGMNNDDARLLEPTVDDVECALRRQGTAENMWACAQADEGQQDDPGEGDGLFPRKLTLQPRPRPCVTGG